MTPGSVTFPANGVRLLLEHRGREVMRFTPIEDATVGEWRIDAELPGHRPRAARPRRSSSRGRRPSLSVEMYVLDDQRVSRVREIRSALVEATALCQRGLLSARRAPSCDRGR